MTKLFKNKSMNLVINWIFVVIVIAALVIVPLLVFLPQQ
jgi:hypothetical protein